MPEPIYHAGCMEFMRRLARAVGLGDLPVRSISIHARMDSFVTVEAEVLVEEGAIGAVEDAFTTLNYTFVPRQADPDFPVGDPARPPGGRSREDCVDWLLERLKAWEVVHVKDATHLALNEGFSLSQLEWARMRLKIDSVRHPDGRWTWQLPDGG